MPCSPSCSRSPMPDSISSCGLFTAPPHSTTSRRARTTRRWPSWLNSTPTARRPSNSTRVAVASVSRVRFGLRRTGLRYASAVLHRAPLRWVTSGLAEAFRRIAIGVFDVVAAFLHGGQPCRRRAARAALRRDDQRAGLDLREVLRDVGEVPVLHRRGHPIRRSRRRIRAPTSSRSSTTSRRAFSLGANRSRVRRAASAARFGSPSRPRCGTASRTRRGCG